MSIAELKLDLISRIASAKDKAELEELMELVKFQSDEDIYITSEEEKNSIHEAKKQIKQGKITSNKLVLSEVERCLK